MYTLIFLIGICVYACIQFPIEDFKKSFPIMLLLQSLLWISSFFIPFDMIVWLFMGLLLDLYLLFYIKAYEQFRSYCIGQALLFLSSQTLSLLDAPYAHLLVLLCFFSLQYLLILYLNKRIKPYICIGIVGCFLITSILAISGNGVIALCTLIGFHLMIELTYQTFAASFDHDTTAFQTQVMSHHYEEVKAVYLNMRGWRHDYHNHIQSIKAYLDMGQVHQLKNYLDQLEEDLNEVDQLVKTGNLMVDAILNSKLSIAKQHHIRLTYKAIAPEQMSIRDTDLCVILGNLMDNAIESCKNLPQPERFIRVYIDIVRKQFYISITNAAIQELGFEERNYISKKRGDHGHGMKRVKLSVDKYDGYLNLKNEAGVFVSELMIPLQPIDEQKLPIRE